MKYCVNCEMNLGNIDLLELENGDKACPKCETEIIEITSKPLINKINDITNAFYNIKETSIQNNAQELIKNAKTIEIGEKKLKKEFLKREQQLKQLHYEIAVIQKISEKLNYNFEG